MTKGKRALFFEEAPDDIEVVGGKALGLVRLVRHGIPTPPGFIITSKAFLEFAEKIEMGSLVSASLSSDEWERIEEASRTISSKILEAEISEELAQEILSSYRILCERVGENPCRVAVRSSAVAEDLSLAAFAGQHSTFLNVRGDGELIDAVKKCWASLFTPRALAYRRAKQILDPSSMAMAVVVQAMVDSRSSGVAFTTNPLTGDASVVVIESIWGLGEYLVAGVVTPDRFIVRKKDLGVVEKFVSRKDRALTYDPKSGGNRERILEDEADSPSIDDREAVEVARVSMQLEKLYGGPVDVEWAVDRRGSIYVLQVRPVTTKPRDAVEGKLERPRILRGIGASPGVAMGRARVLRSVEESRVKGFERGEILVTSMTDPDWVPLMRIASAIVTEKGGMTSHAAITARELGIPAVVGVPGVLEAVRDGETLRVDGSRGVVEILNGDRAEKALEASVSVGMPSAPGAVQAQALQAVSYIPTATKIYMNLGEPDAIEKYLSLPFDGIGLMRIEFILSSWIGYHPLHLIEQEKEELFIDRLASGIAKVASAINPRPVVVRFSDLKSNEYRNLVGGGGYEPDERNPMLGWRGASRYIHPRYEKAFRLELRAIKRVREEMGLRNVWVMVPMVRTLWEAERVVDLMAQEELERSRDFKVWAMAEVPSVAFLIDEFSKYFDGFSIGSNDLTQLVLGIDRDSELLSGMGYFDERDEAVLRAMSMIIRGARKNGRTVSICGQAPSYYPEIVEFLVREGVDSISVNPDAVVSTRLLVAGLERKLVLEAVRDGLFRKSFGPSG